MSDKPSCPRPRPLRSWRKAGHFSKIRALRDGSVYPANVKSQTVQTPSCCSSAAERSISTALDPLILIEYHTPITSQTHCQDTRRGEARNADCFIDSLSISLPSFLYRLVQIGLFWLLPFLSVHCLYRIFQIQPA